MAPRRTTGSRLKIGDPHEGRLADFCDACHSASGIEVIRRALDKFIEAEIAENPGVKARYREAQRRRAGLNVVVAKAKD